jgi:hypothetical protein
MIKKNLPEKDFFEEWEGYFDSWDSRNGKFLR